MGAGHMRKLLGVLGSVAVVAVAISSCGSQRDLPTAAASQPPATAGMPVTALTTATPSTSPTDSALPVTSTSSTPEAAGSDPSQIDTTTEEGLAKAKPTIAEVNNVTTPFGSAEIIKELYLDIQLAMQTNDLDFLNAALGDDPTTELWSQYAADAKQFQAYFLVNEPAKLGYTRSVTNIQQESPASLTWNVDLMENNGEEIKKARQNITLGKYANPDGTERWIIASVNSATPIS